MSEKLILCETCRKIVPGEYFESDGRFYCDRDCYDRKKLDAKIAAMVLVQRVLDCCYMDNSQGSCTEGEYVPDLESLDLSFSRTEYHMLRKWSKGDL